MRWTVRYAERSSDLNPRLGPQKPTAVLRVFKIILGDMFSHLPARAMTRDNGVEGGASWALIWSTCRRRAALEHKIESPDALFPIYPSWRRSSGSWTVLWHNLRLGGCLQCLWPQRNCGLSWRRCLQVGMGFSLIWKPCIHQGWLGISRWWLSYRFPPLGGVTWHCGYTRYLAKNLEGMVLNRLGSRSCLI